MLGFHTARRRSMASGLALLYMLTFLVSPAIARQTTGTPAPYPPTDVLASATPFAGEPITVVATLGLEADWVRQVGGDRVVATAILPANADPHEYDPKPADVSDLDDADLIMTFGLGIDIWAADIIAASGSNAPVVTVTEGLDVLPSSDSGSDLDVDPHVWFDPTRTAEMVDHVELALSNADPAGEADYRKRADTYKVRLDQLDTAIRQRIATIPPERRKLVTNHDALGYYADRYGLSIVGTVIPSLDTHGEASAADIAKLIDLIETEQVPAVFAENTVPPDLAETVAAQTGASFVSGLYTDSLGQAGSGADTYLGLMETDTEIIVAALRS